MTVVTMAEKMDSDKRRQSADFLAVVCVVLAAWSAMRYEKVKEDLKSYAFEHLNNTRYADQEVLIFNRVPKVGSETVWKLLDVLARKNNFSSFSDSMEVKDQRGGENNLLHTEKERKIYYDMLQEMGKRPFSYTKHLNFLDFREFDAKQPLYINFVRDPVQRIVSWYYYMRNPWKLLRKDDHNNTVLNIKRFGGIKSSKTSFDDCVLEGDPECTYVPGQDFRGPFGGSHYSQLVFYCGHTEECMKFESQSLLDKAKENVEKFYSVVGVLEEFDKSLEVLEAFVPAFFRDAKRHYHETVKKNFHENRNTFKSKPDRKLMADLRRNFTMEIEFYEFCKQRLHRQHQIIL